jgi:pilus assembly protein CpaF
MSQLVDYALVRSLQARVADRLMAAREVAGVRARGDEEQQARSIIRQVVAEHLQEQLAAGTDLPDTDVEARLRTAIFAAIYGAGQLQELLENETVENIDINGAEEVWVTYAGGVKERWRPIAASDEDLIGIIANLGAYAGMNARPFSPASPELDVRLADGSRLSAIMSATLSPSASIRRNRYPQMFLTPDLAEAATPDGAELLPDLVSLGTLDDEAADFLHSAVRARCNIVIGGATDAGKTTLLRALVNCVHPDERLVTVERALELGLGRHPSLHHDVRELEEVLPDAEGKGGIDIAALVRRTRRMNPSRVIVGEVLGPEVVEMLSAMAQGNDGSLSTIHARDAAEVFNRISTYAAQHAGLGFDVTHSLIAGSIDFVVFIEKNPRAGGRRTVTQILEVAGVSEGRVDRNDIFAPSPADGRAVRQHEIEVRRQARLDQAATAAIAPGQAPASAAATSGWPAQQRTRW